MMRARWRVKLTAGPYAEAGDAFGFAVDIDDWGTKKTVVVGAPAFYGTVSTLPGKVQVFNCHVGTTTMFAQMGILPDFASAVAASAPTR